MTESLRDGLAEVRRRLLAEDEEAEVSVETVLRAARDVLRAREARSLVRVVNATGVVLHTGLGRAPLGRNQGRGVASGFWFNVGGDSTAQVNVNEDGTVMVTTGHPDIGGSRASMVNITAELLGIHYANVQAQVGDTSSIGYSATTGGRVNVKMFRRMCIAGPQRSCTTLMTKPEASEPTTWAETKSPVAPMPRPRFLVA